MSYKIKILPIAFKDLQESKKWYLEKSELLAEEFKAEISKEIEYVSEYPNHYQIKHKELCQYLVTRFPFSIFYFVNENPNQIVIFGIFHTSRNPKIVRNRKKITPIYLTLSKVLYFFLIWVLSV